MKVRDNLGGLCVEGKGKGKAVPQHTYGGAWGRGVIAPTHS
jgi:hypothetical protein